mgnify:CR=1 FL=1
MTEGEKPSYKRHWKTDLFAYDHYIPDTSRECSYCLTDKQVEIILGMVEPVGWKTRWQSVSGAEIDVQEIEQFRNEIIRRLMMTCCGNESPTRYRYTDSGVLQQSTDDGATWTDAPNYDPRNYSPQFPPLTGDDGPNKRCLASRGMAQLVKEQVANNLTDDMTRYTLGQLITDWVKTYIETSNPFEALLTVIVNQIFALVIAVLRPALTDEVFDTLQCIFYKRMAADATYDNARWENVRADILSQITGVAGVFLEHLVYLLGVAGLTNLARANGYTGINDDCSACSVCAMPLYVPTGGGTDVSFDTETCVLTASSVLDGGNHVLYVWFDNSTDTFDPNKYGKITEINYLSGNGSYTVGYNDAVTGTGHFPALSFLFVCASQIGIFSSAPFTVTMQAEGC